MSEAFDAYSVSYEDVVQNSVGFSGLEHKFFLKAKIMVLSKLFSTHFSDKLPELLDVGCGVGLMHPLILPYLSRLAGADTSREAVDRARHDNPGVDYRHCSKGNLPWPSASFDAVLAVCVIHHVPPSERDNLVAEMRRVTRPGGLVIMIEHNPWNPLTRLAVARCPFDHDAELLDASHAKNLLRNASLHSIESEHFLLFPSLSPLACRIQSIFKQIPAGAQYLAAGRR
ncbi:class I SAM-dependent methyltransferase [Methylobacterium nodulans]|uniref:Methyltransferase type 11 n=1 Tax=Methylobacterium nodulans (strain LMG 21967 / CNCM I-2342 / ORS 2060) TaxID=460265 RepID=B8IDZ5_METNO|nr:class I SAM-dependent methyltransferase [Methylobacterium nodulans]ACL57541.1 Methyltransferase type 11 [Methylobacterium nodulans ORS 2060]